MILRVVVPGDDDDDDRTPPRRPLRGPTDSERQVFAAQWASGVPAVADEDDREDTSPIDLFERAPRANAQDIVARLRQRPERLIPFVGELAAWIAGKMREDSSESRKAVSELRELLSKPPNGATARLQADVRGLEATLRGLATAVGEVAERIEAVEKSETVQDVRDLKGSAKFARNAAGAAIAFVLANSTGFLYWLVTRAETTGANTIKLEYVIDDIKSIKHQLERMDRFGPPWPSSKKDTP